MAAVNPDVQVTGSFNTVTSPTQNPATEDGTAQWALCGYGSQIPRIPGQALVARLTDPIPVTTSNGTFAVWLYNNELIAPSGTYYTLTLKNSNGDIAQINAYRFTAPGNFEIDGLIPYDPNQPPPPLPPLITNQLLVLPGLFDQQFDGSEYTAWQVTLTTDITGAWLSGLIPGNLYTFIIIQDSVGGHTFLWPSGPAPFNLHNATPVSMEPNATTIQTFVCDDSYNLYPIGAATYNP
jgi:hypothetical protein